MEKLIKTIPDYPSKGVYFRHIGPLLANPRHFQDAIERIEGLLIPLITGPGSPILIAGLDARGFIIGTALACRMNLPFVMIRKQSKLPGETYSAKYSMEYGEAKTIELEKDAIEEGDRVVLVDDLLATGGTLAAASELVRQAGARVAAIACLIGLDGLPGREKLGGGEEGEGIPVITLYNYPADRAQQTPAQLEHLGDAPLNVMYVASSNPDKIRAVRECFPHHSLYSVTVPSGVPEQPFGMEETVLGATNRLEAMMKLVPAGHTYVALESGIETGAEEGETPYDFCVVVAKTSGPKEEEEDSPPIHSVSVPCSIPREHHDLLEDSRSLNGSVTFGALVEARLRIPTGTWHEHVSGMTRVEQMKTAIHSDVVA